MDSELNHYTLYEDLMRIALEFLQTADLKEVAIQACDEQREKIKGDEVPLNFTAPSEDMVTPALALPVTGQRWESGQMGERETSHRQDFHPTSHSCQLSAVYN